MFAKAAALSLLLLVVSRLLGLLRESAMAAALGTSALADVAVLMLTLPDWLAGVLASGALAYVLLPAWADKSAAQIATMQRRVALALLLGGSVLAALLVWQRAAVVQVLLPGLTGLWPQTAAQALLWCALALPPALLASLWVTRLQHERDVVGMYTANLVVNGVLIAALLGLALVAHQARALLWLGAGLLLAMALRLLWLWWRLPTGLAEARGSAPSNASLPAASLWLWAALSAGLPLLLPFVARSLASAQGEGSLATFNYAWKLVELPLLLAIQLVTSLAFPAIAKEYAQSLLPQAGHAAVQPVSSALRQALVLAWTLACAAAAALLLGAPALAQLLFGWGRMSPDALLLIADWGRVASWGLLPQAVIAVALTVLAVQGRMRWAVAAYTVALAGLWGIGAAGIDGGGSLMICLNVLYAGVAAVCAAAVLRSQAGAQLLQTPGALLLGLVFPLLLVALADMCRRWGGFVDWAQKGWAGLVLCAVAALCVVIFNVAVSADMRQALRRK